jgi:hypothetical protein
MKRIKFAVLLPIFTFFICSLSHVASAQDIIIKKNGDDIKAKVLEITQTEIKYKRFDNLEGPTIIIPIKGILMITYQNGTKETFEDRDQDEVVPVAKKKAEESESRNDLEKAKKILKSGSKVYITTSDPKVQELAQEYVGELKRWNIVSSPGAADFVLDIKFRTIGRSGFASRAQLEDARTSRVFYTLAEASSTGGTGTSARKVTTRKLVQSLQELLNVIED